MALEYNDYNNAPRCHEVKAECEAQGLIFGIWLTRGFNASQAALAMADSQASFFIAEAEIPAGLSYSQDWTGLMQALEPFDVPKAVVTNFAAFTDSAGHARPDVAAPLIDAGWACLTECYDMGGDTTNWIERRDYYATTVLGWPETQPVLGIYSGRTFASYPTHDQYRGWSVWAAEYVL